MKLPVLITLLPSICLAFTPSPPMAWTSKAVLAMHELGNDENTVIKDSLLRPFGTILVAASLVFNPGMAGANENASFSMSSVPSSSLHVAEEIKLLDMSLPSYGSISDPKANQDSIDFVEQKKPDRAAVAAAKKKSGGNPLVATKSKPMKQQRAIEPRKTVEKRERTAESEETNKVDVRSSYKSRPVYIDKEEVSIEEKKKEKEVKKAESKPVKKEKEAVVASEEKEEGLNLKDVKIVDMEMPSYSGNTATKSKSVFAL